MKTSLLVDEEVYNLDFALIHYDSDNYFPMWKAWTTEDEVVSNPLAFFKYISVSSKENTLELDTLENSLKEKILRKLYEESMDFKQKEGDYLNYHHTGDISSEAYRNPNYSWVEYAKKPLLLKTLVDKTGEEIEFRQSGEKNAYIKKEQGEILRDEDGNCKYLSDKEIIEKGLLVFDPSVYAFNKKGECVGYTSDEWGADGVWVLPEYQKRGIGLELLSLHREQFPENRKIGQMTHSGVRLVLAYFRKNNP